MLMGVFHTGFTIKDNPSNLLLLIFFIITSIVLVICIRQQYLINQNQFLLSMIEHHAEAITMIKKVKHKLTNDHVKELANKMLDYKYAQIDEMKKYIDK